MVQHILQNEWPQGYVVTGLTKISTALHIQHGGIQQIGQSKSSLKVSLIRWGPSFLRLSINGISGPTAASLSLRGFAGLEREDSLDRFIVFVLLGLVGEGQGHSFRAELDLVVTILMQNILGEDLIELRIQNDSQILSIFPATLINPKNRWSLL